MLNTRVEWPDQANVEGVGEIGTNDVRTTSDQDDTARGAQPVNCSTHALHQGRCGRMKAKQFFKRVLESWLIFLPDKIFQVLRQLVIFKHRRNNVLVKEGPRVAALLKGLKQMPDIFSDGDRPGTGFPGNGNRRALLFNLDSIFARLRKQVCPPLIKGVLLHTKIKASRPRRPPLFLRDQSTR